MRAVRVHQTGGPEVLRVDEIEEPEPGEGEVCVRVAAAGVNFIDTYHRSGAYPLPLPFVPGQEAAGTVSSIGPGVEGLNEGDRVAFAGSPGAYADAVVVRGDRLVRVPDGVELDQAAALMLQGMTAHYLATSTFPLESGHRALIHAAAGGVGLLLVQVAKRRGATVIATVSTAEKAELAAGAGADEIIRYTEADFAAEVGRLTEGRGVDVVFDSVGADTFDASLRCLRPRGMLVLFGQSSGAVPPVDLQRLAEGGSLFATRPTLAHHITERAQLERRAGDVLNWVAAGELEVRIGERHPLAEAATAHERLEARLTAGKVLLVP